MDITYGEIMAKINKTDFNWILTFLEECKEYTGLIGWNIKVADTAEVIDDFANVDPNIYEKELLITLSTSFFKETKKRQHNILIHELLHGKIEAYNKQVEEHVSILEEHLVNDLTRGIEKLMKSYNSGENK